ncbi:MAG TPA: class I SAM-dependent methyltransferase [Thermoanaerobaculia bacterium]
MKSIRDVYDSLAARYEVRWSKYIGRSVDATLRRARLKAGDRVIDIGCGTGALLRKLTAAGVRACGVDVSIGMLAHAESPAAAGDAENLPFQSGTFDIAFTASSFHFWPHPARGLEEIRRVLKRGGQLVITDWCDDYVACRLCSTYLRQRIFKRSECAALLEENGFRVLRIDRYKISWIWGLMTAVAEAR